MLFLQSNSPFTFAAMHKALAEANAGAVTKADLGTWLLKELWRPGWYEPPQDGEELEPWLPHARQVHPGNFSAEHASLHPLTREQIAFALAHDGGLPDDRLRPDAEKIFLDISVRERLYLELGAMPASAYPKIGRQLIGRIVLPYRRLRAFCTEHVLREPEILTQRLAAIGVPPGAVDVEPVEKGRPTKHRDRYMGRFEERIDAGEVLGEAMEEARWLREWLKQTLEAEGQPAGENDLPKETTIRNRLLEVFDFRARCRKTQA